MLKINFLISALAALIPLLTGFIWYSPKVFGTAWMKVAKVSMDEKPSGGTMAKIFILTYILGYLIAMYLHSATIHQFGVMGLFTHDKDFFIQGSEAQTLYNTIMNKYGNAFLTFKHGALHGALVGIFFALPLMSINAMFERKGFKYIAINVGYWIVTLALMGGVVCQFSQG